MLCSVCMIYMYMYVHSPLPLQIAVNHAHRRTMQGLLFHQVLSDASPFSFRLIVRRDNLIKDTLDYLVSTEPSNYKKPLQVRQLLYMYMEKHVYSILAKEKLERRRERT